jgi:hypothetical protein
MHLGAQTRRRTVDTLLSPPVQMLFLLFFWVPFALAAYLFESWNPERAPRSVQQLVHAIRHTRPTRPMAPSAA